MLTSNITTPNIPTLPPIKDIPKLEITKQPVQKELTEEEKQAILLQVLPEYIQCVKDVEKSIKMGKSQHKTGLILTLTDALYVDNTFSSQFMVLVIMLQHYFIDAGNDVSFAAKDDKVQLKIMFDVENSTKS